MNTQEIRQQFPMLAHNSQLVYLDSAASALTPQCVIDAQSQYYQEYGVNIARGLYDASTHATSKYESARQEVAQFIGARASQIVFTSGTTMSINMIAHGLTDSICANSRIATTIAEHHSNLIPWQQLSARTGAKLDIVGITNNKELELSTLTNQEFAQIITPQTAVLALGYASNVLGNVNPIAQIIKRARAINPNILVVVDAAQAIAHIEIDVAQLDCDFLAFSGHKVYGPTGIGILYGKTKALAQLTPLITGGEMVDRVSENNVTFKGLPHRLEAGTPNIAGAVGLASALEFLRKIGFDKVSKHAKELLDYTKDKLRKNFGDNTIIYTGNSENIGLLSFSFFDIHPHDVADILNTHHIAVRAGTHCAQPLHSTLGVGATTRISFGIYTTTADIDQLITGLGAVRDIFAQNPKI